MSFRWLYLLYWSTLSVIFIITFEPRLGVFDAVYFFSMTATTIGYGEITPITSLEKTLVMITGWSLYLTLVVEGLVALLQRIPKMKLDKHSDLVIVASTTIRLKSLLEKLQYKNVFVLCDSNSESAALEELRNKYGIKYKVIDSIYDNDLFKDVITINKVVVMTSGKLDDIANTHRAIGTVQVIETFYPECDTLAEVPNLGNNLSLVSSGDKFIDVVPIDLLSKEIKSPGAYEHYLNLIEKKG